MAPLARSLSFLLLCLAFATARASFTPFRDNKCTSEITVLSDGEQVGGNTLIIDRSITDWTHAAGRYYDNLTFPDAPSTDENGCGTGAQVIYWKVDQPDPTCRVILMKDSSMQWEVMTDLPGIMMIRAENEGCYYGPVEPNGNLITSFCCGVDDCKRFEIETQAPSQEPDDVPEPPQCTIISRSSSPSREAGRQQAVTKPQFCGTGTCTHTVLESVAAGTALAFTQSHEWSRETGGSLSVKSGINFITEADVSASFTFNIGNSWMEATETSQSMGNTSGTWEAGTQVAGSTAFYAFTPSYQCWSGDVVCGKDSDGNDIIINDSYFCQPELLPSNFSSGILSMVYISI
ncbi:hypothetical protein GGS23DRAFT_592663 [Durotheca rogersii]|uniref:uncharacterized protein n=1 Tax=Durotheca rogersii TaxID=419775 RepID=UPI002220E8AC|nr:uncharacterized protein GGS23DRAFT_592663 [Durotheca rogersii]KAI5867343.1 hypothetical protein GGS23DRAFT_592663 [Durotheca rogersii]